MPYIASDQRQTLDPLIDGVVQSVRKNCDWTTNKFNYLNWIKYILCELALDLLRPRLSPMFNPFGSPMDRPEIVDLKKLVFALAEKVNELSQGPNRAENLAGLFNYSCTQILFLTMPPSVTGH